MKNKDQGPVEGESVAIFVVFVSVLVGEIEVMIETEKMISHVTNKDVSDEAIKALECVKNLLSISDRDELINASAEAHNVTYVPDEGSCDHYIDMLSSCVSAIRFGLALPCRSRHAAEAADHVWKQRYGLTLFDKHSNKWGKQWARAKFYEALGVAALVA